ncbi:hypothetical protein [Amycolatopsis japonica]
MADRLAVEQDLAHLPELTLFAVALALLIATVFTLHDSDTLAYLMAVGILSAQDRRSPA